MKTSRSLCVHYIIGLGLIASLISGCSLGHQPSNYRAIHQYAIDGDVPHLRQILREHPETVNYPDDLGRTPLHLAAAHCRPDAMSILLQNGAGINVRAKGGACPLHLAAQEGCVDGVVFLISNAADVNARDDKGWTPLRRAVLWDQSTVIPILRRYGGIE